MNGITSCCTGRLGSDAELKYSANGAPFLTFNLAVDDAKKAEDAPTEWLRVVCFGEMAERLAFVGRRAQVSEITDDESLSREIERRGNRASVVLPSTYPPPAHLRPTSEVETSEGSWRVYRVDPRVDSG